MARRRSPVDVLNEMHKKGFVTDDAVKKLDAKPIIRSETRNGVSNAAQAELRYETPALEGNISIVDLYQWHGTQSHGMEITEETRLFHIKATKLLEGITITVSTLSKTLNGTE
jgi:hypothetical protein